MTRVAYPFQGSSPTVSFNFGEVTNGTETMEWDGTGANVLTTGAIIKNAQSIIVITGVDATPARAAAHHSADWPETGWTSAFYQFDVTTCANMTTSSLESYRLSNDGTTFRAGGYNQGDSIDLASGTGIYSGGLIIEYGDVNNDSNRAADDILVTRLKLVQDGGHAEGNVIISGSGSFITTPLAAPDLAPPTSLVASNATSSTVDLDWTDNATGENSTFVEAIFDEDTFTRSDSSSLGTTERQGLSWVEQSGDWSIVSNELVPPSTSGTRIAYVDTGYADGAVRCALNRNGESEHDGRIILRWIDANNYVYVYLHEAQNWFELREVVSGSDGQIDSDTTSFYETEYLRVAFVGDKVWITREGDPTFLLAGDVNNTTGTKHGFGAYSISTSPSDAVEYVVFEAPPATLATDTFTRADSTSLGSTEGGSLAWNESGTTAEIDSNSLHLSNAKAWVETGYTDVDIEVDVTWDSGTSQISAGVLLHYVDANNYMEVRFYNVAVSMRTTLVRTVGGTSSLVSGYYAGPSWSAGDTKTLRVVTLGSRYYVFIDGVLVKMLEDTTFANLGGTKHGLSEAVDSAHFDNLTIRESRYTNSVGEDYTVAGLDSTTEYWFRVYAESGGTLSEPSNLVTSALIPPTSLVASNPTASTIDLDWTDNAMGEDGYEVETIFDSWLDIADDSSLTTTDMGRSWTQSGGNWSVTQGTGLVTDTDDAKIVADVGGSDATAVIRTTLVGTSSASGGVVVRWQDANNYTYVYVSHAVGSVYVGVWDYVGGSGTQIAGPVDVSRTAFSGTQYELVVTLSGSTLDAWLDGVQQVSSLSVSNHTTATSFGMVSPTASAVSFQDWSVSPFAARTSIAADSESYTVQNLDAETTYGFRVYAERNDILSTPSNIDTETTTGGASTVTGSDSGTVSVSESSSVVIEVSASDSGTLTISENSTFAESAFSSSDSGSLSVTESSSFGAAIVSGSDSGTISVAEASAVAVIVSGSDTGTISIGESSSFGTVSRASADSGTISIAESSSFGTVLVSGSDAGTLSVSESSSFGSVPVSTSDGGTVSLTESSTIESSLSVSDSGTLSVTESSSFAQVEVQSSDSGTLSVTESSNLGTVETIGSDSGTISVAEGSTLFISASVTASDSGTISSSESSQFGTIAVTGNDSGTISSSESSQFGTVVVTGSDSGTFSGTESSSFETVVVTGSESGTLSGTESAQFVTVTVIGSDSVTFIGTESSSFSTVAVTRSDSGTFSVIESSSFGTVSVTGSDSGTFSATESSSFGAVVVTGSDSGTFSVTESSSFGTVTVTRNDSGTFSATESSSFGTVEVTGTDAGTLSVAEQSAFAGTDINASDSAAISISESSAIDVSILTGDSGAIAGTETATSELFSSSSDTGDLSISEASLVFLDISGSDDGTISCSESSSIQISGEAPKSASDLGTVSATESSTVEVIILTNDSDTLSVTESQTSDLFVSVSDPVTISASAEAALIETERSGSDSGTISVTENSSLEIGGGLDKSGNDSGAVSVTESSSIAVSVDTADSATVSVTENASLAESAFTSNDSGSITVTESSSLQVSIETSDSVTLSVTENSSFAESTFVSSDSGTISITESSSLEVSVETFDSGTLSVAENSSLAESAFVSSDSGSISATESSSLEVSIETSDSGTLSVTESSSFSEYTFTSNDSGDISATESSSLDVSIETFDSGTLSVTESSSLAESAFASNDSGSISATESSLVEISRTGSDVGTIYAVEASTLEVSGLLEKTASDTGVVSVSESGSINEVFLNETDWSIISIAEVKTLKAYSNSLDGGTLSATESSHILISPTGQDSGTVSVAESSYVRNIAGTSVKVWDGSTMQTGYIRIWNGTGFENGQVHKWNGSSYEAL